jgi:phage minor structural protein
MAVERWAELDRSYIEPSLSNDPLSPIPSDLAVIIVGGGSNLSGGLYETGTAAHALYAVLQDSGWTLGTCDVPGIHDLEMEKESHLALIKEIQNIWGGYLVWDSVNKTVSLRDPNTWQNYTGFQIRYKKNLEHITRTQSNKLVTKMYAFGHDELDIASVNSGVKYITNHSYTSRDYVGIYKNQDIYNATELMEKATVELSLICRPRYLYQTKMVDLRTLPEYSHEDFTEGDMADVIDPDVAPESPRPRLIRHRYDLFKPWKCEVEIGDPQERLIEKLKASFNTTGFVDTKYNGNGQSSGFSIEDLSIENAKIKNLSADKIIANTLMANVNLRIGTGDNVFKADSNGIYLGNAVFADAPFSVDMAGNLIAMNATIQGTITSSTITGGVIRTAASGKRIEIANNQLNSYNVSGAKEGFSIEDWSGIYAGLMYEGGSIVGGMVIDSGLTLYSNTLNSEALRIKSGKHMYIETIDSLGVINIGKGSTAAVDFTGANVIGLDGYALVDHDHGNTYVKAMSSQNLRMQSFQGTTNYVEVWLGSTYLGQIDLV